MNNVRLPVTTDDSALQHGLPEVGEPARSASIRLRSGVADLFGNDLVAMWLYGGQLAPTRSRGDVDVHVVVRRMPSSAELERIRALHEAICEELKIPEMDAWYVLLDEAMAARPPRDLNWPVEARDENWAIKRAHWFAGAYVLLYGERPELIVLRPDWSEVAAELLAQVDEALGIAEHRHPADLALRLCRVLLSFETRNVVHSKLDAGAWAMSTLSLTSQPHVAAAMRVYRGEPEPSDESLIADGMPAFCRQVRALVDSIRRT